MGDVSVMNAHEQNLLMEGYVDVRFDAIFDVTESLRATIWKHTSGDARSLGLFCTGEA